MTARGGASPAAARLPALDGRIDLQGLRRAGHLPRQMDEELAYRLGRGFARVLSDLQDVPS
jgi:hypothetical protein